MNWARSKGGTEGKEGRGGRAMHDWEQDCSRRLTKLFLACVCVRMKLATPQLTAPHALQKKLRRSIILFFSTLFPLFALLKQLAAIPGNLILEEEGTNFPTSSPHLPP